MRLDDPMYMHPILGGRRWERRAHRHRAHARLRHREGHAPGQGCLVLRETQGGGYRGKVDLHESAG